MDPPEYCQNSPNCIPRPIQLDNDGYPIINIFDNTISIMYKWGQYVLKTPVDYIRPLESVLGTGNVDIQDLKFIALSDDIFEWLESDKDINEDFMRELQDKYQNKLSLTDVEITLYLVMIERRIDPSWDRTETGQTIAPIEINQELLDTINNFRTLFINQSYLSVNELMDAVSAWRQSYDNKMQNDCEMVCDLIDLQFRLFEYYNRINADIAENRDDALITSTITYDRLTLEMEPKFHDKIPTPDDGIDIFNESIISDYVPFIRYNRSGILDSTTTEDDNIIDYYKVWSGTVPDQIPDYPSIINRYEKSVDGDTLGKINKPDTIYLTVWSGEGDVSKATKKSYVEARYNLITNILKIQSPIGEGYDETRVLNRVLESLNLTVDTTQETQVVGEYNIYGLNYDDSTLYDAILNDDLLNNYLYIDETGSPFATKTHMNIHFRTIVPITDIDEDRPSQPSAVKVWLTQHEIKEDENKLPVLEYVRDANDQTQIVEGVKEFPIGGKYVQVRISRANSRLVAEQFKTIFLPLLRYYMDIRTQIRSLYALYIPNFKSLSLESSTTSDQTRATVPQRRLLRTTTVAPPKGSAVIDQLKSKAPKVFISDYARKCQNKKQPIIIPPEEIPYYQQDIFEYSGNRYIRQVMPYPPNNPEIHLVCMHADNPFPYLQINRLENSKDYPYIPCCGKKNKMDRINSNYRKWARDEVVQDVKQSKSSHIITTDKILDPDQEGTVPLSVDELISIALREGNVITNNQIYRYGVPKSPNSILHSISIAIQDSTYLKYPTIEEREVYIRNIRNTIANSINISLLKQEMYDFTDEEIGTQLSNPDRFFDPSLFYRAIEEVYNINLYVFTPGETKEGEFKTRSKSEKRVENGRLELPRAKEFHLRIKRNTTRVWDRELNKWDDKEKPVILIFKHWGSEADLLQMPQCELILNQNNINNTRTMIFGSKMNNILHNAVITIGKIVSWNFTARTSEQGLEMLPTIVQRENFYQDINYYDWIKWMNLNDRTINNENIAIPIENQLLDGYGKLRGLIFTRDNIKYTIIFSPSQPENIQGIIGEFENIIRASYQDVVINIFNNAIPSGGSYLPDGRLDGLWYPVSGLGIYGVYIPIIPIDSTNEIAPGPPNPIAPRGSNRIQRLQNMKKSIAIFLQAVKWLYDLSRLSLNDFINRFVIVTNEAGDSSTMYDLELIKRKLPEANTIEEGIIEIQKLAPTMFYPILPSGTFNKDYRIRLYNSDFGKKVHFALEMYDRYTEGINKPPQRRITGLTMDESYFRKQGHVNLFIGQRLLQEWMDYVKKLKRPNAGALVLHNQLVPSMINETDPYIYVNNTDSPSIDIIQNVYTGSKDRALAVALSWRDYKINSGYGTPEISTEIESELSYIIYSISNAGSSVIIDDSNASNDDSNLHILTYGDEKYAAILQLF